VWTVFPVNPDAMVTVVTEQQVDPRGGGGPNRLRVAGYARQILSDARS